MVKIATIEKTVAANLCCGCGTCISTCPTSAISVMLKTGVYVPNIEKAKCTLCGICLKVCPGYELDFKSYNIRLFGKMYNNSSLIGNYIQCYKAHSSDSIVRYNSSSGGVLTQLLIFALNHKIIDGALVTKMNPSDPMRPLVYLAQNSSDILNASRSKYCPVPLNASLKSIIDTPGHFAIVGLPCHIEGIRKVEEITPKLAKKIVLHLGLVCNHAPSFMATEYLIKKMGISEMDVKAISYRGNGWPGRLTITMKNGDQKFVNHFDQRYWGHVFNSYFTTNRCVLCNDKICELSDISFCDAWKKSKNEFGESIIIARSIVGHELVKKAIDESAIVAESVDEADVVFSQGLAEVKKRHTARIQVYKQMGKKTPCFNQANLKPQISHYSGALITYAKGYISSKPQLWPIIDIYPAIHRILKKSDYKG